MAAFFFPFKIQFNKIHCRNFNKKTIQSRRESLHSQKQKNIKWNLWLLLVSIGAGDMIPGFPIRFE